VTLQNRVTPTGKIIADPARGLFMGNRGVLHDENRRLGRARWRHKNWVMCVLTFKGRRRNLMTPKRYTELFFLDEAVALAAGHRPCGECRLKDYNDFLGRWTEVHGTRPDAKSFDKALHAERALPGGRSQRRYVAQLEDLPDGAFVLTDLAPSTPHLVWADALVPYAPAGYGAPILRPEGEALLLTPPSTVEVLKLGFVPVMHPSLGS